MEEQYGQTYLISVLFFQVSQLDKVRLLFEIIDSHLDITD